MWRIAVCCASQEVGYAERLERHLSSLVQSGKAQVWHRGKIAAGTRIANLVSQKLSEADLVVLLLTSELFAGNEDLIKEALAQKGRGAAVIPVLVRAVYLGGGPFSKLQLLPADGQPMVPRRDEDSAWVAVAAAIERHFTTLQPTADSQPEVPKERSASKPLPQRHIKLLFLGTTPSNAGRLELEREVKEIRRRIDYAQKRAVIELQQEWAVNAEELNQILLRHKPTVLHISGHGSPDGRIVLLGPNNKASPVPRAALARLLGMFANKGLRCVVFNACYADEQAKAVAEHIEFVIGMSGAVEDESALAFAGGFYAALADGSTLQESFDHGCIQIELLGQSQSDAPRLLTRSGADPRTTTL